jgi:hypothetical protein
MLVEVASEPSPNPCEALTSSVLSQETQHLPLGNVKVQRFQRNLGGKSTEGRVHFGQLVR